MLKGVCKRSTIKRRIAVAVCALALTVGMAPWVLEDAQAAMVTFSLDVLFGDGPVLPSGTLVATFNDELDGSVTLTMDATALTGSSEKIKQWYFNVSGDALMAGLTDTDFMFDTGGAVATSITVGANSKAGGDGLFDILFDFPTSGNTFAAGETVVYDITFAGLTADNFDLLSSTDIPAGPAGPFFSAAHVLGKRMGQRRLQCWGELR